MNLATGARLVWSVSPDHKQAGEWMPVVGPEIDRAVAGTMSQTGKSHAALILFSVTTAGGACQGMCP